MAKEDVPRMYHSTSLLLPSGQVLSAGGGEYQNDTKTVEAIHCLTNAQLYDPPYLCKGAPRLTILTINSPAEIVYGAVFTVTIGNTIPNTSSTTKQPIATIKNVTWLRLGSVTTVAT